MAPRFARPHTSSVSRDLEISIPKPRLLAMVRAQADKKRAQEQRHEPGDHGQGDHPDQRADKALDAQTGHEAVTDHQHDCGGYKVDDGAQQATADGDTQYAE